MSRAPRRPDGWEGPDDGPPKALRLVEAPEVQPQGARLFPFPAALAIAAVAVSALAMGGRQIWAKRVVVAPVESGLLVVVYPVAPEEPEKETREPVARTSEALPPPPAARVPFRVPEERPPLPIPEVVLNQGPYQFPENWEEASEPFPKPKTPKGQREPIPQERETG